MPFIANNPGAYLDQVVGDGQCVAYVKAAAGAPATSQWTQGIQARNGALVEGTAIATFDENGKYANKTDGSSHAAIYMSQDEAGLTVYDQWIGQKVHQRVIRFKGGEGTANNDGDAFYVIEAQAARRRKANRQKPGSRKKSKHARKAGRRKAVSPASAKPRKSASISRINSKMRRRPKKAG